MIPPPHPLRAERGSGGGGGGGGSAGLAPDLHWYGLELGLGPPTPQLTTLRRGGLGTGHTNFSLPAGAGFEKLHGSQ